MACVALDFLQPVADLRIISKYVQDRDGHVHTQKKRIVDTNVMMGRPVGLQ